MQPQVLFALLDRAEFETICLTICNPALNRFGNRNASASRGMRALPAPGTQAAEQFK